MPDSDTQSSDTELPGKLVKRYVYPDGRLTAVICVENDWQVVVFASVEAAEKFARHFNLTVEEIRDANNEG